MSRVALVAIDTVIIVAVHAVSGYAAHRLSPTWLERDRRLFAERAWEQGGRFYSRRLRIRRWKRLLPEAGDVFAGGFNKARLTSRRSDFLERYVRETRRAELAHWLMLAVMPAFFFWNPWYAGVLFQVYGVAVNVPCIASQRYNRARLVRVLARRYSTSGRDRFT